MRQIFLDVETKKAFDEVGGYFPSKLGISYVGICIRDGFSGKGKHVGFFEDKLSDLWPILEGADVLIGFNIIGFDIETLRPYYSGSVESWPVLDLLDRIKASAGHRISLDAVATQSLGVAKSGSGLDALKYYANKEFDKLSSYCDKDVAITRDLYDYGRSKGSVKFLNKWNRLIETPVDFEFKQKKASGMQMTLMGI